MIKKLVFIASFFALTAHADSDAYSDSNANQLIGRVVHGYYLQQALGYFMPYIRLENQFLTRFSERRMRKEISKRSQLWMNDGMARAGYSGPLAIGAASKDAGPYALQSAVRRRPLQVRADWRRSRAGLLLYWSF